MCSIMGCESSGTAQRFKLPEDPEKRLEWVQFLASSNAQIFKEASWTDISICSDHFTDDCFENLTRVQKGLARQLQLKSSAVPSLGPKSHKPEPTLAVLKSEEEETTDAGSQCDRLQVCSRSTSCPEESTLNSKAAQVNPVLCGVSVSCSTDVSYAVTTGSGETQPKVVNADSDLSKDKAALLQMKGKYVVNESCLLQLFRRNCPSCGSKCKLEKITHGSLLIMNQQCLQCEYRHQWKSLANASFPTAEGQHLTGDAELTAQTEQATASDDSLNCSSVPVVSEIINFSDDESDSSDEGGEESEEGDKNYSSDWEWNPPDNHLLVEELTKQSDEELCEDEDDEDSPVGLKLNQLCPECGKFFNILKPHTCEYKIKPYSCNVCGKRCVTEVSLKAHSKIHREDYEHQCRFCLVSFQTRLDKLAHEQSHQGRKKPYQCPDCSATFTNSKARNNHLRDHRGPRKHTCNVCKIEFNYVHQLRRHSVVHTGVKPFVCEVCQRSFNQAGHLKSHMRLHTGERPYKCQHCDKSFNHNVSLKSHVQRYHSQAPGSGTTQEMEKMNPNQSESEKDEMNEMESNTGDDQEKDSESGRDPDFDYVEEEEEELEEEEEEEKEEKKKDALKAKKRSTGRPLGRPKRNAAVRGASLVQAVQAEAGGSNAEAERTTGGDEESEGEQSNSDPAFDPTEEKEKRSKTKRKSTGRARGRSKISKVEENDSDSDFDPAEKRKKKTDRGQNTGKRRGRPKKKAV